MELSKVCDMQIGSIIELVPVSLTYLDTIEVFPCGDKTQLATAMFLSVCHDTDCRKCIPSKKDNYVFFNTLEFGHVMSLNIWQFKNFTSQEVQVEPPISK